MCIRDRAEFDVDQAIEVVRPICAAVRDEGEAALRRFSAQFDGISPAELRVPDAAIDAAVEDLDEQLRDAIEEAICRRRQVCERVEVEESWRSTQLASGAMVGQALVPVQRVGLYVPGGVAPLASSVLMNVVPAQVAGVRSLAVASPPQAKFDGLPHPVLSLIHI